MSRAFVGRLAPQFSAMAYDSLLQGKQAFRKITLDDYKGRWLLFFFYPFDFTFVCPTEIINFSNSAKHFKSLNCDVLGCSGDSHFTHSEWVKKPKAEGGLGSLEIPLLADIDKTVSKDYGVYIDQGGPVGAAWRGTFLIDDKQKIRHISINDLPVGRNIDEYLRLVQGYQHFEQHGEVCPAKWVPGSKTLKGDHNDPKTVDYWKTVHAKN